MQPVKKPQPAQQGPKNQAFDQLQQITTVVEAHDQVIFQSIIGINVLQKILIDKGIITIEELEQIAESEALSFKERVDQIIGNNEQ